eukprot:scaffold106_cov123-Cylindrotheca_fusiformis.AAC.4
MRHLRSGCRSTSSKRDERNWDLLRTVRASPQRTDWWFRSRKIQLLVDEKRNLFQRLPQLLEPAPKQRVSVAGTPKAKACIITSSMIYFCCNFHGEAILAYFFGFVWGIEGGPTNR